MSTVEMREPNRPGMKWEQSFSNTSQSAMMVLVRSQGRACQKGQGQLPQPLRKGQAAGAALFISRKIGAVVLEPCGQ